MPSAPLAADAEPGVDGGQLRLEVLPSAGAQVPTSLAEFVQLGSTSTVKPVIISSDPTGLPACPGVRVTITVPQLSDRDFAAALARVFNERQFESMCGGSAVFAFHPGEPTDTGFTAGRLQLDTPATTSDRRHHLEVDSGMPGGTQILFTLSY